MKQKFTLKRWFGKQLKQSSHDIEVDSAIGSQKSRHVQLSAPARLASILSVTVVVAIVILNTISPAVVGAFTIYNQSDWSGGTGTDPSTQYQNGSNVDHTTPGEISLTNPHTNWCSTANCDDDWTRRQAIRLDNYAGGSHTDGQIRLTVPYDADMQADFDDLRFVNSSGDTDFNHYIYDKTDSTSADVFVEVPTIDANAVTAFYMYYGNGVASTTSASDAVNFVDDFGSGSLAAQWNDPGSGYSIANNEITIDPGGVLLGSSISFNRDVRRVFEFDLKLDLSSASCETQAWSGNIYATDTLSMTFQKANQCDSGQKYHVSVNTYREDTFVAEGVVGSPNLYHDTYYRFKYEVNPEGGTNYYYSIDGGETFTEFTVADQGETDFAKIKFWTEAFPVSVKNIVGYDYRPLDTALGIEEQVDGKAGYFITTFYDLGSENTQYGDITLTTSGTVDTEIYAFTASSPAIALDPRFCTKIESGDALTDSSCVDNGYRYIAFLIYMSGDSGGAYSLTDIDFEYLEDSNPPPTNASDVLIKTAPAGTAIAENAWTNDAAPYFSWTAGADGVGESGIKGYCLYLGTNSSADPITTQGILPSTSAIDVDGACPYAVSGTSLDVSGLTLQSPLTNGETYYINIKAIDQINQVYVGSSAQTNFRFDNAPPTAGTLFTAPTITNTKQLTVSWLTTGVPHGDSESGLAGVKYCVTNATIGFTGCQAGDPNWYGAGHAGSGYLSDPNDAIDFLEGTFTLHEDDAARLDDSVAFVNFIHIDAIDNAGNNAGAQTIVTLISQNAAPAPTNLVATPSSNTSNSFAFSWDPPIDGTYFGDDSTLDYCWSVNEQINEDASNCTWTGAGDTDLAAGPYATQQGTNTLYMITKDQTGNVNNDNVATVTFSASTTAPGIPEDLEISDVSTRATSTWKLAMSWTEPTQVGAGVSNYRIYRSTDNVTFSQVGSTSSSNLSFIDSGLSQALYYYHIKACDNAGSCGVASTVASRLPTGRFTTPARLTADTDQPKVKDIGTRKGTIYWFTDRESDSKIAYGTKPGTYQSDEIGNSTQTSNHTVNLTNLQPGTTYYYIAKWTDGDGNTGQSTERSFTTEPAPSVSEVEPTNITIGSVEIKFKTKNTSKVNLVYGKSEGFGGIKSINTATTESTYSLNLSDLDDGTKYFFKLNTADSDGNEYSGDIYSFTTPAAPYHQPSFSAGRGRTKQHPES